MQLVADDLDVGPLLRKHLRCRRRDRLAERVILINQVDAFDLAVVGDHVSDRCHFHVGIGVEAEMPEIAFLVRERRVDCGIIEKEHFLARIALVVLEHGFGDRMRDRAAVALHDEARAVVERFLELNQRFLRIDLVVEGEELDFLAIDPAGSVDGVDVELVRFLRQNTGVRGPPGEWVDESDLDVGLRGRGQKRRDQQQARCDKHSCTHGSSFAAGEIVARVKRKGIRARGVPVERNVDATGADAPFQALQSGCGRTGARGS